MPTGGSLLQNPDPGRHEARGSLLIGARSLGESRE